SGLSRARRFFQRQCGLSPHLPAACSTCGTKRCWSAWTSAAENVSGRENLLMSIVVEIISVALALTGGAQTPRERPQEVFDRAIADFRSGRIVESAAGFDNLVKLAPEIAPELWQRGIALYYAGRYKDCRAQFESHRTVNPNDVENAAWHFLCVARAESLEKPWSSLLPVGPAPRVPIPTVSAM